MFTRHSSNELIGPQGMAYRRTLKHEVACRGIGLHSGKPVRLVLKPAPAESGVVFVRTDVSVEIPASLENLAELDHATTLSREGVSIGTVEHLLSALRGMGLDDLRVEVDGPEVPILDGSAAPFVILIHEAGIEPLQVPREYIKVTKPVEVFFGGSSARLEPADQLRVSYRIGFDHPLLRRQAISLRITPATYIESIAPARTFGFLREVETLRRKGLVRGGSLDNAIVIGESGILNKLRFQDEFVRHKVLDAIGDLALLPHPVVAHLDARKAGHAVHAALARKLMASPDCWALVRHPPPPVLDLPRPALGEATAALAPAVSG